MRTIRTYLAILSLLVTALYLRAGEPVRIDLGGEWEFRQSGDPMWRPANVPGCIHTDLLEQGMIEDPFYGRNEKSLQWIGEKDWEYRKTFYIGKDSDGVSNVWLVLEGVDTYATVSVNGLPVCETDNMFRTWRTDIKEFLKTGENELKISFESVFRKDIPKYLDAPYRLQAWPNNDQSDIWLSLYARKAGYHYGWDWGPRLITSGIWKPAYIEIWEDWKVESARFKTISLEKVSVSSGKAARVKMAADVHIESDIRTEAAITILCDGKKICSHKVSLDQGHNSFTCPFTLKNAALWWSNGLGEASMHNFDIIVEAAGVKASVSERTGIRTAEVIREDDRWGRSFTVRLNGLDVFCKGANWIPIDNFPHRRSRDDYDRLIGDAAECNMNMLRVWD